jgi:hypothetical protein
MNHLDGIQNVLKGTPSAKLVENARKLFKEVNGYNENTYGLPCIEILYFDC